MATSWLHARCLSEKRITAGISLVKNQISLDAPMLRFTIRDVLWPTVVVAMGTLCYVTNQRAIRVQKENDILSAQAKNVEQLYSDAAKLISDHSKKQGSPAAGHGLSSSREYQHVRSLDEAAAVLRSQLIADGKPELALLLNDDRLRDAIRKMTESFQPRPIKKTEWEDKIRPMCVKMADEGYWPPGSSFVGFYHLTENNVDYDGLGLRLNVGGATFNMLAVFDVWYGRRPGANRPPGGAAPAGKSAPAAPMPTIKQQLERPG